MKVERNIQLFHLLPENIVARGVEIDNAVDGSIVRVSTHHHTNAAAPPSLVTQRSVSAAALTGSCNATLQKKANREE